MINTISLHQIWRFLKERGSTLSISLGLGILIYLFVIHSFGKSYNIFNHWKPAKHFGPLSNDFNLYTGDTTGVYHSIGRLMTKDSLTGSINIKNIHTAGGYENAMKVLADSSGGAFGLVQEEAFRKGETVREQLNYVTPMYQERMHIIYRKAACPEKNPTFSNHTSEEVLRFLADSDISIGPVGSGTQILSSYLINELNDQIYAYNVNQPNPEKKIKLMGKNLKRIGMKDGNRQIRNGGINIMFNSSGSPTYAIQALIEAKNGISSEFGFINVEPSFVTNLRIKYNINLMTADFKKKYTSQAHKTTFSTFAYLVTNKNTVPADIKQFLYRIHKNKKFHLQELAVSDSLGKLVSPLLEFDSYNNYKNQNKNELELLLRDFLLLIVTLITSTIGIFYLLSTLVSNFKNDNHHDILVGIISNNIPQNAIPSFYQYIKLRKFDLKELGGAEYLKYQEMVTFQLMNQTLEIKNDYVSQEEKELFESELSKFNYEELLRLVILLAIECGDDLSAIDIPTSDRDFFLCLIKKWEKILNDAAPERKASGYGYYLLEKELIEELKNSSKLYNNKKKVKKLFINSLNDPSIIELIEKKDWFKKMENNGMLLTPFLKKKQSFIVNRIVQGISNLFDIRLKISEDYTTGLLMEKHYNFLLDKTDEILTKLKSSLYLRLGDFIEYSDQEPKVIEELLSNYFLSGYLSTKKYKLLSKRLKVEKLRQEDEPEKPILRSKSPKRKRRWLRKNKR